MFLRSPRKFKNYLINPKQQLRYSLYFIASGFALTGIMITLIFLKLRKVSDTIAKSGALDLASQAKLNELIFDVTWISLLAFGVFCLIIVAYSIIITHRIAGPQVAILAYISELRNGNLDAKRTLRKYDELHPIMDALQDFAEDLKTKSH
jgi:nitrogen fixation/metabolism regulation signal transduction histidine kinase